MALLESPTLPGSLRASSPTSRSSTPMAVSASAGLPAFATLAGVGSSQQSNGHLEIGELCTFWFLGFLCSWPRVVFTIREVFFLSKLKYKCKIKADSRFIEARGIRLRATEIRNLQYAEWHRLRLAPASSANFQKMNVTWSLTLAD